MNNKSKWIVGIILATIVLLVLPFAWLFFLPFRMMGNANGWYMPMMSGSPSMMAFGMMFLVWLTLLGSLVLIGLSIIWLVKELTAPKGSENSKV